MSEKNRNSGAARVLNVGSLNVDHVYNVRKFVQPGETIASNGYARFAGGKGLNQSIALARAGAEVAHAGLIGADGVFLRDKLAESGVDTEFVRVIDEPSGHAVIQVAESGENCIILHGGANLAFDERFLDGVFGDFSSGDALLVQNETNMVPEILERGAAKKMFVAFNPAPMTPEVASYPLEKVDLLIVNETEGGALAGTGKPSEIPAKLAEILPGTRVVLTLGAAGAVYFDGGREVRVPAPRVDVVDTTAAGDTFIGYLLAGLLEDSNDMERALETAVAAAGICVRREGAADSIPFRADF